MNFSIFISYSRKNTDAAVAVSDLLQRYGASVFIDQDSLGGGENYRARIAEEIERCDALILLFSRHAADSEWVIREVNYADEHGRRIIVIRLDTTPLPRALFYLNQREYIDLSYFEVGIEIRPETVDKLCRRTLKLVASASTTAQFLSKENEKSLSLTLPNGFLIAFVRFVLTTMGCFVGLFVVVRLRDVFLTEPVVIVTPAGAEDALTGFVGLLVIATGLASALVWCVELGLRLRLTSRRGILQLLLITSPWSVVAFLISTYNPFRFEVAVLATVIGLLLTLVAVYAQRGLLSIGMRIALSGLIIWWAMFGIALWLTGGSMSTYRVVGYTLFAAVASVTLWYPELLARLRKR